MSIASPAARTPRAAYRQQQPESPAADEWRDELTRRRLLAAVDHLPGLSVESYEPDWWDGQAHVACLVIRGGRRTRRLRVIETEGECVVLPFSRRVAQRWLAARRRPHATELRSTPREPAAADVVLDASADAVRCPTPGCVALRPLDYPGCCPVCGG
jgi:hypothetical protein